MVRGGARGADLGNGRAQYFSANTSHIDEFPTISASNTGTNMYFKMGKMA